MLSTIVELVMGFLQYFAFITDVDVDFPDAWKDPMYYFSVVNLDFDFIRDLIPGINDIRIYFILLSIAGPLFFVFLGLLFLNKKRVVLWYFLMVFAIMLLAAGVFGSIISASTDLNINAETANSLLYAGGALCVLGGILYLVNRFAPCCRDHAAAAVEKKEVMEIETKNINMFSLVERIIYLVLIGIFLLIAFGFFGDIPVDAIDGFVGADGFTFGLGVAFAIIFLIMLGWLFLGFSRSGRERQWEVTQFFESGFLKVLLVGMSLAYIPIGSGVFLMFNCNDFSCGDNYRLPDRGSVIYVNNSAGGGENCVPCQLASNQRCPITVQKRMCAGATHERLEHEVSTDCAGMRTFFWPAAFLIIIMYVLGLPWMFHRLIHASSVMIFDEFPSTIKELKQMQEDEKDDESDDSDGADQVNVVDHHATEEEEEDEENERWMKKVAQSANCARFLFSPFEYKYRYTRLFQLIQKLLIVGTSVYIIRNTAVSPAAISLGCSLAIHFVATVLLMKHAPFISAFEDRIADIMSTALTIACLVAILLLNGVDIPVWLMIVLIVLNGLLPICALIIGFVLEWSSSKKTEEEIEKEKVRRLKQEMDKRTRQEEEAREAEEVAAAINASAVEAGEVGAHSSAAAYTTVPVLTSAERARQAAMKKEAADAAVHTEMEAEMLALHERQETVDLHVDRLVKGQLNRFLMVGGILGFLALACAILGLIVRDDSSVLEPFPSEWTVSSQYAGYSSWDNFTSHCCCALHTNSHLKSEYTVVEKWLCENGRIKERVRERSKYDSSSKNITSVISGENVRGFCSVSFKTDCTTLVDGEKVKVTCTPEKNVTQTEISLW